MCNPKFTKKDFDNLLPTNDDCLERIFRIRHKDSTHCPKCNNKFSYYKLTGLKVYSCAYCRHKISPTAGTIFHKSSTPLRDWFYAIYLFTVSKNGVSGKYLERQLGVTYKTAWRIANRIRKLFSENIDLLSNIVEMDETYYGGKEKNKHRVKRTPNAQGRSIKTKIPIIGAVERKGSIIAKIIPNTKKSNIQYFTVENIKPSTKIKTDEYTPYKSLVRLGYKHDIVEHSRGEYVKEDTYTNTLEGFWSQLKRSINGTHHSVSPKYLQAYIDEFAYRYNRRNSKSPIFLGLLQKVAQPL